MKTNPILPNDNWTPLTHEEAIQRVKAHPITKDMTYEQQLEAIKARFDL